MVFLLECNYRKGDLSVMEGLLEMCEYTEKKLGRDLHEKEVDFLEWVCERYEEERELKHAK